ncbi:MAG: hypothetical protein R3296_04340 [Oleiphilaceae bacterium]|nr:hypothetical protein [Oleiphilaceae bacterium]
MFKPLQLLPSRSLRPVLVALVASLFVAGCGIHPIYTPTGQVLSGYGESHATPYVLEMDDIGMACSLGESLDPLLYSFKRVKANPETTGSLLQVLAGICAEREAVEEELRYLRAEHKNDLSGMRDARNAMQRKYGATANRRLKAFNRGMTAFRFDPASQVEELDCPCYRNDQDELTFMMALLSGAQAVLDDAKAGGRAGVSRSLAPQVERAAACLDSEKWGGLPGNIRAVIWVLLPDTRPDDDLDPWAVMKANREVAMAAGMRTAMALELVMAENVGRTETVAEVLAFLAESEERFVVRPEYQLVDLVGMEVALFVSDRIWTDRYGYRTPSNRFGRISDEQEQDESINTEGLL